MALTLNEGLDLSSQSTTWTWSRHKQKQSRNLSATLKRGLLDKLQCLWLPVSQKDLINIVNLKLLPNCWVAVLLFWTLPTHPTSARGACISSWCPWTVSGSRNADELCKSLISLEKTSYISLWHKVLIFHLIFSYAYRKSCSSSRCKELWQHG